MTDAQRPPDLPPDLPQAGSTTETLPGSEPPHLIQPTAEEVAEALAGAVDTTLPPPLPGEVPEIRPAPEWTELNPFLAFEAGKHSVELERSGSVEIHLAEQKLIYTRIAQEDPQKLVQALLDRDRIIAQFGREISNGKMGGKLLREFVRAALASADRAQDPLKLQKFLEEALGAPKADARQLRLKGTTL